MPFFLLQTAFTHGQKKRHTDGNRQAGWVAKGIPNFQVSKLTTKTSGGRFNGAQPCVIPSRILVVAWLAISTSKAGVPEHPYSNPTTPRPRLSP